MKMNMYEINRSMEELIDPETGELLDFEAFDALNMAREEKLENAALWYKDLTATASAIREEEKALAERRKAAEQKAGSLKRYLSRWLDGARFETPRVAVTYRSSKAVEIADEAAFVASYGDRDDFVSYTPKISKTAVSAALKNGEVLTGAELVDRVNMQIK